MNCTNNVLIKTPLSGLRNVLSDALSWLTDIDAKDLAPITAIDKVFYDQRLDRSEQVIYHFLSSSEGEKSITSEQRLMLTFKAVNDLHQLVLIPKDGENNKQAKCFAESVNRVLGFEYALDS